VSVSNAGGSGIAGAKYRSLVRSTSASSGGLSWTTTGSPTVTTATNAGVTYDLYTYTGVGSGTLVSTGSRSVYAAVLVIAGGGGGGSYGGAGGGGGGVVGQAMRLDAGTTYTITVGAGGTGGQHTPAATANPTTIGTKGSTSSVTDSASRPGGLVTWGGGYGAHGNTAITNASDQATGGGGTYNVSPGTAGASGIFGYGGGTGFTGGVYGNGGGGSCVAAGNNGTTSAAGAGANGYTWPVNSGTYGGGGGSVVGSGITGASAGGSGGGGAGYITNSGGTAVATSGGTNTGGGGGGSGYAPATSGTDFAGAGGSGIVIIAIPRG
jgi:hypothetical protein